MCVCVLFYWGCIEGGCPTTHTRHPNLSESAVNPMAWLPLDKKRKPCALTLCLPTPRTPRPSTLAAKHVATLARRPLTRTAMRTQCLPTARPLVERSEWAVTATECHNHGSQFPYWPMATIAKPHYPGMVASTYCRYFKEFNPEGMYYTEC